MEAVLAHQQPAGQALINSVQPVAGGELRNLHAMHEGKTAQLRAQPRSGKQNILKHFRADAHAASRHLHDGPEDLETKSLGKRHPYHAFLADDTDFHTSPIVTESDQRRHAVVQKIGKLNFFAGFLQDLVLGKVDGLEVGTKQVVFLIGKRQKNQVEHRFSGSVRACARMQ